MYCVTQGGPSARRDLDPLQLRGYFENKRACFTTPWGRRMSPEAWPSLRPFPALLPPLLASQVSAVHLVTLLALGQPRQRLERGTAAGAQGIGRPVPFRSLPPPASKARTFQAAAPPMTYPWPSPPLSSLPAGRQPLQLCSGLGDSASEQLGCLGDQVRVSSALVFSQDTPLHLSPCLPATWESSCLGGSGSGGRLTRVQRCHGGGGLSFIPRVLWENFRGAQALGR